MADSTWQAINDHAAVRWDVDRSVDGVESATGPVALVFWKDVTWRGLQDLGLSRITYAMPGTPRWQQEEPPSAAEIQSAWERKASERGNAPDFTIVDDDGQIVGFGDVKVFSRRDGERPEDFYGRVAAIYQRLQLTSRAPTAGVARLAGVPKSTAVAWVHQARRRGLLPPSDTSKERA